MSGSRSLAMRPAFFSSLPTASTLLSAVAAADGMGRGVECARESARSAPMRRVSAGDVVRIVSWHSLSRDTLRSPVGVRYTERKQRGLEFNKILFVEMLIFVREY